MTIQERIVKMLSANLGISESDITADRSFADDLKMDSLDKFDMIVEVGDEFGFDPDTVNWGEIRTVGDLTAFITHPLKSRKF